MRTVVQTLHLLAVCVFCATDACAGDLAYRFRSGETVGYLFEFDNGGPQKLTGLAVFAVVDAQPNGVTKTVVVHNIAWQSRSVFEAATSDLLSNLGYRDKHFKRTMGINGSKGASIRLTTDWLPGRLGMIGDWMFPPLPKTAGAIEANSYPVTEQTFIIGPGAGNYTNTGRIAYRFEAPRTQGPVYDVSHTQSWKNESTPREETIGSGNVLFDARRGLVESHDFKATFTTKTVPAKSVKISINVKRVSDELMRKLSDHRRTSAGIAAAHWSAGMFPMPKMGFAVGEHTILEPKTPCMVRSEKAWFPGMVVGGEPGGSVLVETGAPGKRVRLKAGRTYVEFLSKIKANNVTRESQLVDVDSDKMKQIANYLTSGDKKLVGYGFKELRNARPKRGDPDMVKALFTVIVKSDNKSHRMGAMRELRNWAGSEHIGYIAKLVEVDHDMRFGGGLALIEFGSDAEPHVLLLLRKRDVELQRKALDILAKIGTTRSLASIKQTLAKTDDTFVELKAKSAIRAIEQRAGIPSSIRTPSLPTKKSRRTSRRTSRK